MFSQDWRTWRMHPIGLDAPSISIPKHSSLRAMTPPTRCFATEIGDIVRPLSFRKRFSGNQFTNTWSIGMLIGKDRMRSFQVEAVKVEIYPDAVSLGKAAAQA